MYATDIVVLEDSSTRTKTGAKNKIEVRTAEFISAPSGYEEVVDIRQAIAPIYRLSFRTHNNTACAITLTADCEVKLSGSDQYVKIKDVREGMELETSGRDSVSVLAAVLLRTGPCRQIVTESGEFYLGSILVRPFVPGAK